jgi:hypothetical protein
VPKGRSELRNKKATSATVTLQKVRDVIMIRSSLITLLPFVPQKERGEFACISLEATDTVCLGPTRISGRTAIYASPKLGSRV